MQNCLKKFDDLEVILSRCHFEARRNTDWSTLKLIIFDLIIFVFSAAVVFFLNILPFVYFAILLIGPFVWVALQATPPLDVLLGMGRRSFFFNLFMFWPAMMFLAYSVFSFLFALDTWAAGNVGRPFGVSYFFDDLSFWEILRSTLAFFVEYPFAVCVTLAELFVGKFEYPLFEPQVVTGIEYGFIFGGSDERFANVFSTFLFWNIPFVYFSKVMLVAYSKVFSGKRPTSI